MKDDEFKLELERIRGDIKNLETVVRMSISEQKNHNCKHGSHVEQITECLGRVESKLWWIQGILASTGIAMTIMIVRLLMLIK